MGVVTEGTEVELGQLVPALLEAEPLEPSNTEAPLRRALWQDRLGSATLATLYIGGREETDPENHKREEATAGTTVRWMREGAASLINEFLSVVPTSRADTGVEYQK